MHVKTHLKRAVLERDFNRIFVDNKNDTRMGLFLSI